MVLHLWPPDLHIFDADSPLNSEVIDLSIVTTYLSMQMSCG